MRSGVALLIAPLWLLPGSALGPAPPQGTLRVGLHDAEPFAFRNAEGRPDGFAIEILTRAAQTAGRSLEFVDGSWSECLARLESGEIDLLLPMRREGREDRFDFSRENMAVTWGSLFSRPGNELTQLTDLAGRRIAVVRDDAFSQDLRDLLNESSIEATFLELDKVSDVASVLIDGRADVAFLERYAGHGKGLDLVETLLLIGRHATLHVGAPKGRYADFLDDLDGFLAAQHADPNSYYAERVHAWFSSLPSERLPAWVPRLLLAGAGLVIVLAAFSTLLRRTVRARTEELNTRNRELEASETRLRLITDAFPALIATVDGEGRFVYCNAGSRSWFGLDPEHVLGESFTRVAQRTFGSTLEPCFQQALAGRAASFDVELAREGEPLRWAHAVLVPQPGRDGRVESVHTLLLDVSDRRRADEERRALEDQLGKSRRLEAVGRLASGVAHDFRNILAILSLHAEEIEARGLPPREVGTSLSSIRSAIDHAQGMTQSLLTFAQRAETHKEDLDLESFLARSKRMLQLLLPERVRFEVRLECESPPWIHADPHQMQQVFLNLALNARDAMPGGGRLSITLSVPDPENVRITFADTGTGIPAEHLERVFEPFFTTKPKEEGTGLGLAMVHGIVKEHGGRIEVRSQPGDGSVFEVVLPRIEPAPEHEAPGFEPVDGTTRRAYLGVGSQQARHILAATLTSLGFEVVPLREAAELAQHLREPDQAARLLLLDADDRSFMQAFRDLPRNDEEIPVILMGGPASPAGQGVDGERVVFLRRPFSMSRLAEAVGELLATQEKLETP